MKRRNAALLRVAPLLVLTIFILVSFSRHVRDQLASDPHPHPHLTASFPLPRDKLSQKLVTNDHHKQQQQQQQQQQQLGPQSQIESILFPDWQVFVLLPASSNLSSSTSTSNSTCFFSNGASSPAAYLGLIPSSSRHAFSCFMPSSTRRLRSPYKTPSLIHLPPSTTDIIPWKRIAYESLSTPKDLIIFAKGINTIQGRDRHPSQLTCVFYINGGVVLTSTPVSSSSQEVFRCPHPLPQLIITTNHHIRVSLQIAGHHSPIPSVASYHPPAHPVGGRSRKALTCACTMVSGAAKFVHEWAAYHRAIGVEQFVLYDNGVSAEDVNGLQSVVGALSSKEQGGYDISRVYWPWPKTQEAGFSHCAPSQRDHCTWIAYIDVDEFIYSPTWSANSEPNRSMIAALLPPAEEDKVGQVSMGCVDFGPSGQREHPRDGVTQGYTCKWSEEKHTGVKRRDSKYRERRHKSMVRTEAVAWGRLRTWVHHFEMGPGWETRWLGEGEGVVNHYKYQAWSEFRKKFKRRVSAYVADWRERRSVGSRDRIPVAEDQEPSWWARKDCQHRDTGLRDTVRRWFLRPNGTFPPWSKSTS